jgi:hypothetical protein
MVLRPPVSAPTPAAAQVGLGQARAAAERDGATRGAWTLDDTERWLTDYPLPAAFKWNNTRAYPIYRLKKGYGFWLRTAGPYHPPLRGLFMLCHEILAALRPGVDPMPGGEQLAALLLSWDRRKELPWSDEDRRTIAPDTPNPAENTPDFNSDSEPAESHDPEST